MKWEEITDDILKELYYEKGLSDKEIADLYGVSRGKVSYRRKKGKIYSAEQKYRQFRKSNQEIFEKLNEGAKGRLIKPENINGIAKALTHYIFRNGPVEDMHSEGKLSEQNMMQLNKFMVNRLAGILTLMFDEDWVKLELLYGYYSLYGHEWDSAVPDMEEIELLMQYELEDWRNKELWQKQLNTEQRQERHWRAVSISWQTQ